MAGDGQTKVKQARSLLASDLVTHIEVVLGVGVSVAGGWTVI